MNTSMTINAPRPGCCRCTSPLAERSRGVDPSALQGYDPERHHQGVPLARDLHLPARALDAPDQRHGRLHVEAMPKWNPINICSYHLQEAGATPVQEIAYAMANAISVLDAVRERGDVDADVHSRRCVGRISFFLNAGIRFVEEICKGRAMAEIWDELTRERYGVEDAKLRRFPLRRAGQQPGSDRGPAREQRHPHRARVTRRHALEEGALPRAPASGLERGAGPAAALGPAVVAAHPADPRLRDRPARVRGPLRRLPRGRGPHPGLVIARQSSRAELDRVLAMGGAVAAVENAYMKQQLVASGTRRMCAPSKAAT